MLLTGEEIGAMVGQFLWPFFRIAAMVGAFPVFSSAFIPMRVRLIIALALTVVIAPIVPAVPQIDPLSLDAVVVILQQVLIGIAMGFIFHLVINAFIIGGQIIAMQMGLGFSTMVDPVNGAQAPVLSMLFLMLVTLFFLLLDGHLLIIAVVAESFHSLPISTDGLLRQDFWQLASWGSDMFVGAMKIALPAITALLLVNMALGVMGRAAPQLNIFAVGFSITITGGFYIIMIMLPVVLPQFEQLTANAFAVVQSMMRVQ